MYQVLKISVSLYLRTFFFRYDEIAVKEAAYKDEKALQRLEKIRYAASEKPVQLERLQKIIDDAKKVDAKDLVQS